MISIRHTGIESIEDINLLLKAFDTSVDGDFTDGRLSRLIRLLTGENVYKIIIGRSDDIPFALCIYHYRSDFSALKRGISVDILFSLPEYRATGTEKCILQVLAQKSERENLDFLEILCALNDTVRRDFYASTCDISQENFVRFFVDDKLHEFGSSGCSCGKA